MTKGNDIILTGRPLVVNHHKFVQNQKVAREANRRGHRGREREQERMEDHLIFVRASHLRETLGQLKDAHERNGGRAMKDYKSSKFSASEKREKEGAEE